MLRPREPSIGKPGARRPAARGLASATGSGGWARPCLDSVWAEVAAHFPSREAFGQAIARLGVRFDPLSRESAETGGELWRHYCQRQVRRRDQVMADFLIGAHALVQADALLCRDRGYYRECFADLQLLEP